MDIGARSLRSAFVAGKVTLQDVCVRLPIDGIGVRCGGLVQHNSTEDGRILALEGINHLLSFGRLQIHLRIRDDLVAVRRGQAKEHLDTLVVGILLYPSHPGIERDIRSWTSICAVRMIEICPSGALWGVIELHEKEIEV